MADQHDDDMSAVFDPLTGDPLTRLDQLRAAHRVVPNPSMGGALMVLSAAGCKHVLRDDATFSSAPALGGPLTANNPPEVMATLPEVFRTPDLTAGVDVDMPRHADLRRTMRRAWEPAWVDSLAPRLRELADHVAASLPRGHEVDLVTEYARPYVNRAMGLAMGVDDDMVPAVTAWAGAIETIVSPVAAFDVEAKLDAARRLHDYTDWASGFIDEKRPERDVIGVYAHGDGDVPPLGEANTIYSLLVHWIAGTVTAGHSIATCVDLLLRHPDLWKQTVADPDGYAPKAFEEALRLAAPHRGLIRMATGDTEIDGHAIPAGSVVLPLLQSAGRDETYYADADLFQPGREGSRDHVSFGHGRHLCVGAELARTMGAAAIAALARHAPLAQLAHPEQPTPIAPNYFFHGPANLRAHLSSGWAS